MGDGVTLNGWLFLLLLIFAGVGVWVSVLGPLASRMFYHRRERHLTKLEERLEFGLSGYALAKRSDWLDRLLNDPVVAETIEAIASERGQSVESVRQRARKDAEEIVPFFNTLLYFRLGYWLGRWALRTLFWIRSRFENTASMTDIPRDSCVVLVSNHRSNLDPFIMIYLSSRRSAISYSAGEWALIWPIHYFIHAMGFYVIRRDQSGDRLHQTLVQRYVFLAASRCIPQGLFLEGGLSRDGKMLPLKLGLLNYILRARGESDCRDIALIPVGLSYDRVPEDKTLVAHKEEGFTRKGPMYSLVSSLRFFLLVMPRMLGVTKPWGTVVANFGEPLFLNRWLENKGCDSLQPGDLLWRDQVSALGEELKTQIDRLIPVLPMSLLADVLLDVDVSGISELAAKRRAENLAVKYREAGILVEMDAAGADRELDEALYTMMKRQLIELGADGLLRVTPEGGDLLVYYRNAVPTIAPRDFAADPGTM